MSHTICENKLKMDKKPKTIHLLEENIGHTLFDIGLSSIILDLSPQANEMKEKVNK